MTHLVRGRGRLVTKQELLDAIWPEAMVGDAVLKVCIAEIRKALGDRARGSKFIETVHRRGYRFIAESAEIAETVGERAPAFPLTTRAEPSAPPLLVGREEALDALASRFERALRGERQTVFVTGAAGIGKSTLVEAFLATAAAGRGAWTARGQCLEQYGSGEAYLPVLDALTRLCRERGAERVLPFLRRHAPTWLVQLTSLCPAEERQRLARETLGATRERMLREAVEAIEAVAAEAAPLVIVLEDLHWSDFSTLDLISLLSRRREPARVLLIGTYRPVDAILSQHPLRAVKQDLQARGFCVDLPLALLDEAAVARYLEKRLASGRAPAELARSIHRRTEGHPLFMVNMVDYLEGKGLLSRKDGRWKLSETESLEASGTVPEGIRQMIEMQVERLAPAEQVLLEAASIVGAEFSAHAVAAALEEKDFASVDERCEALARRHQFLRPLGAVELPDGTVNGRYAFSHSLYQGVLYARVLPARRIRSHLRIGESGERVFGARVGEIASELSVHFEAGHDDVRAVRYRRLAAETDSRRFANREAIAHLERALELARSVTGPARTGLALDVLEEMGLVRRAMGDMKGAADSFQAMVDLAREEGILDRRVKGLLYLVSALFWVGRERCLKIVDEALALSERLPDGLLRTHARGYCGHWSLNLRGWRDEDARACAEAIEAARRAGDRPLLSLHVTRYTYALCLRSDYAAACLNAAEGVALAEEKGDAFDYLLCQFFRCWALLHAGRWGEMRSVLRHGIEMAERNGHQLWARLFGVGLAHLHVEARDFDRAIELCEPAIREAERDRQETGQLLCHAQIVLGLAHAGAGRADEAIRCLRSVAERLDDPGILLDWLLRLPLHFGLGSAWLAAGKLDNAFESARALGAEADRAGERTYAALARLLHARIAARRRDREGTQEQIRAALSRVDEGAAPLAAWRVFAAAADLVSEPEAATHRARASDVLDRLASSLDARDPLAVRLRSHGASVASAR